jgi:hypothetical protein
MAAPLTTARAAERSPTSARRSGSTRNLVWHATKRIRLDPTNVIARGEAYEAESDLDNAIADFEQALELDLSLPKSTSALDCVQAIAIKAVRSGEQTTVRPDERLCQYRHIFTSSRRRSSWLAVAMDDLMAASTAGRSALDRARPAGRAYRARVPRDGMSCHEL